MSSLKLADLDDSNKYLIDLGSTLDLFGPETDKFLEGRGQWNLILNFWRDAGHDERGVAWEAVAGVATAEIQQALELLVTADTLAFDSALQARSGARLEFDLASSWVCRHEVLVPVDVPDEFRKQVRTELQQFRCHLDGDAPEFQALFHAADKHCHDHGFGMGGAGSWFAESSDHPLRALYYLLLSETAKVHCFLSRAKRQYIEDLSRVGRELKNVDDPHRLVTDTVMGCLDKTPDLLPPVAEIVILHALDRQISPGKALLEVRYSDEATEYRRGLAKLRRGARVPTFSGQAEVVTFLDELRALSMVWLKDPHHLITHDTTWVDNMVSAIPNVGPILAQLLPEAAKQMIPTQWLADPAPFHLFISRWFRRDEKTKGLAGPA